MKPKPFIKPIKKIRKPAKRPPTAEHTLGDLRVRLLCIAFDWIGLAVEIRKEKGVTPYTLGFADALEDRGRELLAVIIP